MRKLLLLFLIFSTSCSSPEETRVLVLSTIHGAHEKNPNYSYEDLFSVVREFSPEIIGIEIRPEDIRQDNEYLKSFYHLEMIMLRDSFPGMVVGLDYYGESVKGDLIPKNVFMDTTQELGNYVKLMRELATDSLILEKEKQLGLKEILEEQKRMALEDSPQDFVRGDYDSITFKHYRILDSLLNDTRYKWYSDFNRRRDQEITKNALKIIQNNPGKKIMILVGANHRGRIMDSLSQRSDITIITDLDFEGLGSGFNP